MMKVREGKTINFNKYGKKIVESPFVGLTEPEKQLTRNGILKKVKM
jgi:hypothetical protein